MTLAVMYMFHHIHTNLFQLNVNKEKNAIPFSAIRATYSSKMNAQNAAPITLCTVIPLHLIFFYSFSLFLSFPSIYPLFLLLMVVLIFFQYYNSTSRDEAARWRFCYCYFIILLCVVCFVFHFFRLILCHSPSPPR